MTRFPWMPTVPGQGMDACYLERLPLPQRLQCRATPFVGIAINVELVVVPVDRHANPNSQ